MFLDLHHRPGGPRRSRSLPVGATDAREQGAVSHVRPQSLRHPPTGTSIRSNPSNFAQRHYYDRHRGESGWNVPFEEEPDVLEDELGDRWGPRGYQDSNFEESEQLRLIEDVYQLRMRKLKREKERLLREDEQMGRSQSPSPTRPLSPRRLSDPWADYEPHGQRHHMAHYDLENLSDDEIGATDEAYDFSLPSHWKKSSTLDDPTEGSWTSESTEKDIRPLQNTPINKEVSRLHISESQYTGDGSMGGLHSMQLSVVHEPSHTRSAMFRWIHITDHEMNFEDFRASFSRIDGLSMNQRSGIDKLLRRVKRKYDRPLQMPEDFQARNMDTSFEQLTISAEHIPQKTQRKRQKITWICLPYFCLEQYSERSASSKPGNHPMKTLCQTRLSTVSKKRDMSQAVRSIPGIPEEWCYHVDQTWFLILDDTLLVTCGRMPIDNLHGKSISIASAPQPSPSRNSSRKIFVSYGDIVRWSFTSEECPTWLAFVLNFWEFWPKLLRFYYLDKPVTADQWPRILELARRTPGGIHLTFSPGSPRRVTSRGILNAPQRPLHTVNNLPSVQEEPQEGEDKVSFKDSDTTGERQNARRGPASRSSFSLFTWLNGKSSQDPNLPIRHDEKQTQDDLRVMDQFMLRKTRLTDESAYRNCPEVSHASVYTMIERELREMSDSKPQDRRNLSKEQRLLEKRVDLFNLAESLFEFFLPLDFHGPTTLKFWGAIHRYLRESSPIRDEEGKPQGPSLSGPLGSSSNTDLSRIIDTLERLVNKTSSLKEILSEAHSDERRQIVIPEQLIKAWPHCVMLCIFTTQNIETCRSHARLCLNLIDQGALEIIQSPKRETIVNKSVLLPFDIAVMVGMHLCQDMTSRYAKIMDTYAQCSDELVARIENDLLDRTHQDRAGLLHQEFGVVISTTRKQVSVIRDVLGDSRGISASYPRYPPPMETYRARNQELRPYERDLPDPSVREQGDDVFRSRSRGRSGPSYRYGNPFDREYEVYEQVAYQQVAPLPPERSSWPESSPWPTDQGGYREFLLQECLNHLETRLAKTIDLTDHVSEYKEFNIHQIDTNKDRQESAVYAFTVVTVVFLPLSTVASILGMNTNDVRHMENNQWVFWVVALPLTCIIITLTLIWTGELANFGSGFADLWRRSTPQYSQSSTGSRTIYGRRYRSRSRVQDAHGRGRSRGVRY